MKVSYFQELIISFVYGHAFVFRSGLGFIHFTSKGQFAKLKTAKYSVHVVKEGALHSYRENFMNPPFACIGEIRNPRKIRHMVIRAKLQVYHKKD